MISLRPCVDVLDADGDWMFQTLFPWLSVCPIYWCAACSLIICSYTSFQWFSKLKIATGFMLFLPPPLPATTPSWFFSMYLSNSTVCTFQAMLRCSQPIACSTFNNDGSIYAYSVRFISWFCYHQWVYVIVVSLFLHTNTPTHIPRQSWFINLSGYTHDK